MRTATAVDQTPGDDGSTPGAPARPGTAVRAWLPVAGIVVAAAALSLPRLGSRTLWLDEAYTVGATNQLLDTFRHTAATQALYYLLVWPVSRLSTDAAWLRLPSAAVALVALVVTYRLARRLAGEREALLATGGLALSWGLARYSVEARSYTLALLLVTLTWLAMVAAIQSGPGTGAADGEGGDSTVERRWWWLFWVTTALVPLSHGLATLNYPTQLVALALLPGDRRRVQLRRALLVAPVVAAELAVMFFLGASDVGDWVPPLSIGQLRGFKQLMLGFGLPSLVLTGLVVAGVAFAVRDFWRTRTRTTWLRLLPVLWAVVPTVTVLAISVIRSYAAGRYVFPSLPAVFLLAAAVVGRIEAPRRVVAVATVVALLMLVDHRYVTTQGLEGWSEATACIATNAQPGDRMLVSPSMRPPLDYYWPDHPQLEQVEALSPVEDYGTVRRFYDSTADTRERMRETVLADTSESIWYADRDDSGRLGVYGLAIDEQITAHYELREPPWYFRGEVILVRLDPIGSQRPRAVTTCDTVEPPDGA